VDESHRPLPARPWSSAAHAVAPERARRRLNKEDYAAVERRGHLPTPQSVILIGAILLEQDDEWAGGNRLHPTD
jgi:hypothetical protein